MLQSKTHYTIGLALSIFEKSGSQDGLAIHSRFQAKKSKPIEDYTNLILQF